MDDSPQPKQKVPESDPYGDGRVTRELRLIKDPLHARACGILTNAAPKRFMGLIPSSSRVVRVHDVHELVCSDENQLPGGAVEDVSYLAFIVFEDSGVVAVGDHMEVEGEFFGRVMGFNETHAPNHFNIVLRVAPPVTGLQAGWSPATHMTFNRAPDESEP